MQQVGYDVVTMDTKTDRIQTRQLLDADAQKSLPPRGTVSSVQGNFDVALLKKGGASPDEVKLAVEKLLIDLGPQKLIANLGEGLTGSEDPDLVNAFVDSVHSISENLIKNSV